MKQKFILFIILFLNIVLSIPLTTCKGKNSNDNIASREWVNVGVEGTEYTTHDGIKVTIPAGAVTEDTRFYVRKLSTEDIDFFIEERGTTAENILFAIEGTDDVEFNENITLTFTVDTLEHSIIPVIHTIDMAEKTYTQGKANVILDPSTKTVTLTVSHFCALAAEIEEYYKQKGEAYCSDPATACRCGKISVEQNDSDFTCSDKTSNCQVVSTDSTVIYLDCNPEIISRAKTEEVSTDCVPNMNLSTDKLYINPGGSVEISSLIKIGCAPIDDQMVSFAIESGDGSINPYGEYTGNSGDSGTAKTTLTAGNSEGKITVSAESTVQYYLSYTYLYSSIDGTEEIKNPEEGINKSLSKTIDIYVTKIPELVLTPDSTKIAPGETINLNAYLTKNNEPLNGQSVTFTVSGPGTLGSGSGTTSPASTSLTSNGIGTITVTAKCNVNLTVAGENVVIPLAKSVIITSDEEIRSYHITVSVGSLPLSGNVGSFYAMQVDSYQMNYEFDLSVPGSIKGNTGAFFGFADATGYPEEIVKLPDVTISAHQSYSDFTFTSTYNDPSMPFVFESRNLNAPSNFEAKLDGTIAWTEENPVLSISLDLDEEDGDICPFTFDVYSTDPFGVTSFTSRFDLYQVYFYDSYTFGLYDGNVISRQCRINVGGMKTDTMPITINVDEI